MSPGALLQHGGTVVNACFNMNQPDQALSVENVSSLIRLLRDQRVILDTDLARLYGIQTFRLKEASTLSLHADKRRLPACCPPRKTGCRMPNVRSGLARR